MRGRSGVVDKGATNRFRRSRHFGVQSGSFRCFAPKGLARISHQLPAAEADTGMSAAFRSVGLLDVLQSVRLRGRKFGWKACGARTVPEGDACE